MVFPVVMYGCEHWTVKKTECWRIDAFELWCWRRLLRVPWTSRRSNQFILKEITPRCSLKGMMLKLKLQYFGHLMEEVTHWKRIWCWEGLGQEKKGVTNDDMAGWHHRLDGHEFEWTPGVGDGQGGLACYNSWGRKESDMTEWLNWTENRCEEKGTLLHCGWECKLRKPLWKTVWRFLPKLKLELPYDPAIPLLGIYLEKISSVQHYLQYPGHGSNLNVHWQRNR